MDDDPQWNSPDYGAIIQRDMAAGAKEAIGEVNDLVDAVRMNFINAASAANIPITNEDKLARMNGHITAQITGYELIESKLVDYNVQLNAATSAGEAQGIAQNMQSDIQDKMKSAAGVQLQMKEKIADITKNIADMELQMSVIPKGHKDYEALAAKIKEANTDLTVQEASQEVLQGQMRGMIDLHDNYLKSIIEGVSAGKTLNEVTRDRKKHMREQIDAGREMVGILREQEAQIAGMGPGLDKFIDKWGGASDMVVAGFDSAKDSIIAMAGSIPFVGNALQKHMTDHLTKASESMTESWVDFQAGMRKSMSQEPNPLSFTQALSENIGILGQGFGALGGGLMSAFMGPLALIGLFVGFLVMAWKESARFEEETRSLRMQWGALAQDMGPIKDMGIAMEARFRGMGITMKDVLASAGALRDTFASQHNITESQVQMVTQMETQLGIASATTAEAIDTMMKLGDVASGAAEQRISDVQVMARRAGVDFAKVMDDIANASETAMLMSRGSARELAKAAVHARRMGTSLDQMADAADKLLDFESSINAQMTASAMFGKMIHLDKLRSLALEGDAEGMAKEQLRIMDEMGGLRNMSRWQQRALADAMGVELSTLYEMQKTRERELELKSAAARGDANAIKVLEHRAAQEAEADRLKNMSYAERMALQLEEQQAAEAHKKIQDAMAESILKIKKALIPIVEKMLPMIDDLMSSLNEEGSLLSSVIDGLIVSVQVLAKPFELILGVIQMFRGDMTILNNMFSDTETIFKSIIGLTIGWFILMKGNIPLISGLLKGVWELMKGGAGKLKNLITGGAGGPGGGGPGGGGGAPPPPPPGAGSSQGPGMVERFNQIDMTKVLKAAAAMVILAGAIWILAKAFQEFGKVDWANAWPGFAAIAALVIAAKSLSSATSDMIKGAAAMFILGGALIPTAYAFTIFGDVKWENAWPGFIALGALALVAKTLGSASTAMIKGAAAIAILGVALIPLAYGLNIMKDVGIGTVIAAAAALIVLGAAGLVLGTIMSSGAGAVAILLGAVAIAALGASLIPLAYALSIATPAIEAFGTAVASIFGGLAQLIMGVGQALASIVTSIGEVITAALTAIGDAISGVITSIAEGIATVVDSVSGAMSAMVDDIVRLSEIDALNLLAVAGALATVGAAMAGFGIGSGVGKAADGAGNLIGGLFNKATSWVTGQDEEELNKSPLQKLLDFAAEADSIIAVADKMDLLLNSFDRLADMEDNLESVSGTLDAVAHSISSFSRNLANMSGSDTGFFSNFKFGFSAEDEENPMDKLLDFINQLSTLEVAGPQMESLVASLDTLGGMTDSLAASSEALYTMGGALDALGDGLRKLHSGGEEKGFFSSIWDNMFGDEEKKEGQPLDIFGPLLDLATHAEGLALATESIQTFLNLSSELVNSEAFEGLQELGESSWGLFATASGINAIAAALINVQSAMTFGNLFSSMFGGNETAISLGDFIELGKVGDKLAMAASGVEKLLSLDASDAEGISAMSPALKMFTESIGFLDPANISLLPSLGQGVASLLAAFTNNPLSDISDEYGPVLNAIAGGLGEIFSSLSDTKTSTLRAFPLVGEGLDSLLRALATSVGSIRPGTGGILEDVGGGLAHIFKAFKLLDSRTAAAVPAIGDGIAVILSAISGNIRSVPADIKDVLTSVGQGIAGFTNHLGGINEDVIAKIQLVRDNLPGLLTAMANIDLEKAGHSGGTLTKLAEDISSFAKLMKQEDVDKIVKVSTSLKIDDTTESEIGSFGNVMKNLMESVSGQGAQTMLMLFKGLNSFASEDFSTGLTRATKAIMEFVRVLGTIPEDQKILFNRLAMGQRDQAGDGTGSPPDAVPLGDVGTGANIPVAEALTTQPAGKTTPASAAANRQQSNKEVEKKLQELIDLMKNGGISVNLDGKKVSKGIAQSQDK